MASTIGLRALPRPMTAGKQGLVSIDEDFSKVPVAGLRDDSFADFGSTPDNSGSNWDSDDDLGSDVDDGVGGDDAWVHMFPENDPEDDSHDHEKLTQSDSSEAAPLEDAKNRTSETKVTTSQLTTQPQPPAKQSLMTIAGETTAVTPPKSANASVDSTQESPQVSQPKTMRPMPPPMKQPTPPGVGIGPAPPSARPSGGRPTSAGRGGRPVGRPHHVAVTHTAPKVAALDANAGVAANAEASTTNADVMPAPPPAVHPPPPSHAQHGPTHIPVHAKPLPALKPLANDTTLQNLLPRTTPLSPVADVDDSAVGVDGSAISLGMDLDGLDSPVAGDKSVDSAIVGAAHGGGGGTGVVNSSGLSDLSGLSELETLENGDASAEAINHDVLPTSTVATTDKDVDVDVTTGPKAVVIGAEANARAHSLASIWGDSDEVDGTGVGDRGGSVSNKQHMLPLPLSLRGKSGNMLVATNSAVSKRRLNPKTPAVMAAQREAQEVESGGGVMDLSELDALESAHGVASPSMFTGTGTGPRAAAVLAAAAVTSSGGSPTDVTTLPARQLPTTDSALLGLFPPSPPVNKIVNAKKTKKGKPFKLPPPTDISLSASASQRAFSRGVVMLRVRLRKRKSAGVSGDELMDAFGMTLAKQSVAEISLAATDVDLIINTMFAVDVGGIPIIDVEEHSPASEAGLQRHDIIVSINDAEVTDVRGADVHSSVTGHSELVIEIIRVDKKSVRARKQTSDGLDGKDLAEDSKNEPWFNGGDGEFGEGGHFDDEMDIDGRNYSSEAEKIAATTRRLCHWVSLFSTSLAVILVCVSLMQSTWLTYETINIEDSFVTTTQFKIRGEAVVTKSLGGNPLWEIKKDYWNTKCEVLHGNVETTPCAISASWPTTCSGLSQRLEVYRDGGLDLMKWENNTYCVYAPIMVSMMAGGLVCLFFAIVAGTRAMHSHRCPRFATVNAGVGFILLLVSTILFVQISTTINGTMFDKAYGGYTSFSSKRGAGPALAATAVSASLVSLLGLVTIARMQRDRRKTSKQDTFQSPFSKLMARRAQAGNKASTQESSPTSRAHSHAANSPASPPLEPGVTRYTGSALDTPP